MNNAESRSVALILCLLNKHVRLVSILPDTHPKVMENLLDIDSLLKTVNIHFRILTIIKY